MLIRYEVSLRGIRLSTGKPEDGAAFYGVDPATGERLEPVYHCASIEDLNAAQRIWPTRHSRLTASFPGTERGRFLRTIADGIEAIVPEIVERANRETALPEARLKGEAARTINQLRLFAQVVEEGSWVNARIDPAQPDRKPAAALRHSVHDAAARPGRRIRRQQFPAGVFSGRRRHRCGVCGWKSGDRQGAPRASGHQRDGGAGDRSRDKGVRPAGGSLCAAVWTQDRRLATALVEHPKVKAVGFTGSLAAGKALMQRAAARPEPIPCFMEMSSVNPVFVLPEALRTRGAQIASGLVRLVHARRGAVLHQAGAGVSAA